MCAIDLPVPIVIEIDENQHKYCDKEDEVLRVNELLEDIGKPFALIRINPDSYKIDTKQIRGCFDKNYKLACKKEWDIRIVALINTIRSVIDS